jgi:uncharacterized protein (DUF885 family)
MKVKALSLAVLIAAGGLYACSKPVEQVTEQSVAESEQTEDQRIAAFFETSFQDALKRSPMYQSYLGIKWDYDKWNDISLANEAKEVDILKSELKQLESFDYDKLSDQMKLSYDIFKLSGERQLANDEFRYHSYIMHQFRALHTQIPSFLINIHRVKTEQDAQAYLARLENVGTLVDQLMEQMQKREELGVYPPKWSYDQMISASKNVITGMPFNESTQDSTILADFKGKVDGLDIAAETKQQMILHASTTLKDVVEPAYQKIIATLTRQRDLSPEGDGVWRLPDGSNWYQNRLNWFTTTEMNAEEVHELGLKHVERIHGHMRDIMKQVNYDGDMQSFFKFMREDEQFYYPNTDEGREAYMVEAKRMIDVMEEKIPEYFGLIPKADMVIKRVEAFREKSAGKAFYQSPSKDGTRPGIYYANLYDMKSMPTYQMEALAYHEGIPGHHMQRAIAQELEGVPEFQKYASFTAYTEGWGLYTEELAKDMGFYEDPYSDFGRLAMELWRACRLVVDTGIHAKKWSREEAIQYLIDNTPNPENDSVKAIERYIAMPGQATAYMIGKLKIMELRAWAKAELGDKFDIKGFHDEILKDGPVPLSMLETKIKTWAAGLK